MRNIVPAAINTAFTIDLRACAATPTIVDCAELAQNTAMIIQILSQKDSFGVLEGKLS